MGAVIVLLVVVLLAVVLTIGFVKNPENVRAILYCILIGLMIFVMGWCW